jgi:hypothetical protein
MPEDWVKRDSCAVLFVDDFIIRAVPHQNMILLLLPAHNERPI